MPRTSGESSESRATAASARCGAPEFPTAIITLRTNRSRPVRFTGVAPDLFREGQGIVAQGAFGPDRTFHADQVLAKHDETYMPREVADRLFQ